MAGQEERARWMLIGDAPRAVRRELRPWRGAIPAAALEAVRERYGPDVWIQTDELGRPAPAYGLPDGVTSLQGWLNAYWVEAQTQGARHTERVGEEV